MPMLVLLPMLCVCEKLEYNHCNDAMMGRLLNAHDNWFPLCCDHTELTLESGLRLRHPTAEEFKATLDKEFLRI